MVSTNGTCLLNFQVMISALSVPLMPQLLDAEHPLLESGVSDCYLGKAASLHSTKCLHLCTPWVLIGSVVTLVWGFFAAGLFPSNLLMNGMTEDEVDSQVLAVCKSDSAVRCRPLGSEGSVMPRSGEPPTVVPLRTLRLRILCLSLECGVLATLGCVGKSSLLLCSYTDAAIGCVMQLVCVCGHMNPYACS